MSADELAGDPITAMLTERRAMRPDRRPQGGHGHGWFAARPSGTEDVYKIYAESFRGADHLVEVQNAARTLVTDALTGSV